MPQPERPSAVGPPSAAPPASTDGGAHPLHITLTMARISRPDPRPMGGLAARRGASNGGGLPCGCTMLKLVALALALAIFILLMWLQDIVAHDAALGGGAGSRLDGLVAPQNVSVGVGAGVGAREAAPPASSSSGNGAKASGEEPVQIAYAISLIRCSDFQSSTSGLLDAATIIRHSVHQTSVRNPSSGSKYDYKLYAIVHTNAQKCSHILTDLGYEVILRDSPIKPSEIRGEYLRKNVHKEWCCGSDEFVKLYAYTITDHPIVVHTDIDFMYYRPMDDVFDAMLLPKDSDEGKRARGKIEMEYPDKAVPDDIRAYLTRDYHQVIPGRKAGEWCPFLLCSCFPASSIPLFGRWRLLWLKIGG